MRRENIDVEKMIRNLDKAYEMIHINFFHENFDTFCKIILSSITFWSSNEYMDNDELKNFKNDQLLNYIPPQIRNDYQEFLIAVLNGFKGKRKQAISSLQKLMAANLVKVKYSHHIFKLLEYLIPRGFYELNMFDEYDKFYNQKIGLSEFPDYYKVYLKYIKALFFIDEGEYSKGYSLLTSIEDQHWIYINSAMWEFMNQGELIKAYQFCIFEIDNQADFIDDICIEDRTFEELADRLLINNMVDEAESLLKKLKGGTYSDENAEGDVTFDLINQNLQSESNKNLILSIQEKILDIKKKTAVQKAKIEERDIILSNLSHSIKNLISTVIDPLTNLHEEKKYKNVIVENALKGADLIREIVNAMNLSYKGSIKDFQYDVGHCKRGESISMEKIIIESLKHSISNMFDSKYFGNFMRNYFPDKEIYHKAKNIWNCISSSDDIEKFINEYMFSCELIYKGTSDMLIGNEKGSAIKFQILFQEIILNAVKYVSFIEKSERKVTIEFKIENTKITFKTVNNYLKEQRTKTTGLGHVIISNFAKLLEAKQEILKNGIFSVSITFKNLWKKQERTKK